MANGPTSPHEVAFGDVERELAVTRNVLAAVPVDKFAWKPHEKSMSLGGLAIHVAHLPDWARVALDADELDFASAPRPPATFASSAELLAFFDQMANGLRTAIKNFDMARWPATWTMRQGTQVFTAKPRPLVFRVWSVNHLVHHRGQLALYLRLLNVAVPTIYFNTADDPTWVFD